MNLSIIPFDHSLLPQAGELLAGRHQRDRAVYPELPGRFEDPQVAALAVEAAWKRESASGVAGVRGDRLLGYIIGETMSEPHWGRSAWVRSAGCALAPDQDPELARDLYAALTAPWVEQGCFTHFALMPVSDPSLLQAWYSLGFGIGQVHALLDLERWDSPPHDLPAGVEIRLARPGDLDRLGDLPHVIWRHQVKAPVWGIALPEEIAAEQEHWDTGLAKSTGGAWLAFKDGKAVGSQVYWPANETDENLMIPPNCVHMGVAGTLEEARGLGIGRALTRRGLADARDRGYRFCDTDWRSANLLASRFWPKQGFRPVFYRLVRRVDPRIAWAGGDSV